MTTQAERDYLAIRAKHLVDEMDALIQRAAELFTRYITVAPPEYHDDLKQWLIDAGVEEK